MNQLNQRLVTFTGIGLIVILLAIILFTRASQDNAPRTVSMANLDTTGQPILGEEDAPVTLVVFEDFTCSHCRLFNEDELPKIEREFIDTGKAKLYFVNFAFLGAHSRAAALASECVYLQNPAGFWDYEKILMRSQGKDIYNTKGLVELAKTYVSGIDSAALSQCIEEEETAEILDADIAMARAVGVDSTPVVIVNDDFAPNYSYDAVAAAIREALGEPSEDASATEDNASEDSATEDSVSEDNATEDSVSEDNATEDSATEDSVSEDNATEDSVSEDNATEDSATEDSASETNP